MIYIASPYSHPDTRVMTERWFAAVACVAKFAAAGQIVYSPIVHFHSAALWHSLPTDAEFWRHQNEGMLAKADSFLVLAIPGWETSLGVLHELQWWARNRIVGPIYYAPPHG